MPQVRANEYPEREDTQQKHEDHREKPRGRHVPFPSISVESVIYPKPVSFIVSEVSNGPGYLQPQLLVFIL